MQGDRGELCDFLMFLKDSWTVLQTVVISANNLRYICRCRWSFSCLKRLKSYTRSTMGQGLLSSLAQLAIERTLIKSLEKTASWYDRVTEHFVEKEPRAELT